MMELKNPNTAQVDMLWEMYDDDYFPNNLVDRISDILWVVAKKIEISQPATTQELYTITHEATKSINELQCEFAALGSEIETVARESIYRSFLEVIDAYEFSYDDADILIGPREW